MRNNLEKFLIDKNRNNEIFENSYADEYKVYKEYLNERFDVIYYKRNNNGLSQRNYEVGGYFDRVEECLYDANYELENMFTIDKKIRTARFSDIEKSLHNELNKKMKLYLDENKDHIKKDGRKKFEYLNQYDVQKMRDEINKIYITQSNPKVELKFICEPYILARIEKYANKDFYMDYLNNAEKLIDEVFKELTVLYKEELGFEALTYDYKVKYLEEISKINSPINKQLNLNRNIYQSLQEIYAKSVTINIEYGEDNLNFKFDLYDLKRSLANGSKSASTYGVAYSKVSEFIKNNDPNKSGYNGDFEFSHINSITHGKKEYYNKNNFIENQKENKKNKDYER